jgi:hypothetical protein
MTDRDYPPEIQIPLLAKLPSELRALVWQFLGTHSPYTSFALVAGETTRLAPQLRRTVRQNIVLSTGSFLFMNQISVFGVLYIRSLSTKDIPDFDDSIHIEAEVEGIEYAASLGGVCALKLFWGSRELEEQISGHDPPSSTVW